MDEHILCPLDMVDIHFYRSTQVAFADNVLGPIRVTLKPEIQA